MNLLRLVLIAVAVISSSADAAKPEVRTQIGFSGVHIAAALMVNADAPVLWATLTDYNQLATFVPGLTKSRIVSSPRSATKLVEQEGEGGLLALVLPDHVILSVDEHPYTRIGFRSVSGWVASMRGQWTISGNRAPVMLTYQVDVLPLLPPPPALTDVYVQEEVALRLAAVGREAERRMQANKK
jgi:hypothetical protein